MITTSASIYQTKNYSNSNKSMLFLRKTDEAIWKPPPTFVREPPPPFQLTPLYLSNFFRTLSLSKFQKRDLPPNLRGEGNYAFATTCNRILNKNFFSHTIFSYIFALARTFIIIPLLIWITFSSIKFIFTFAWYMLF